MNTTVDTRAQRRTPLVLGVVLGLLGLATAGLGAAYIAGMFGLSAATASQIVNAIEVGGWALAIAMTLVSGGIAGTVVATARWAIAKWGATAAAA